MTMLARLLDEYEESHRHPINIRIHWVAEPLAILALMALASSVTLFFGSLLWPFLAILLLYFAQLSVRVTIAFLPVVAAFLVIIGVFERTLTFPTWQWAAPLFAVCWITLLIGHKIEGRVPSVFQNPNLIFVGPAWLVRIIFRQIGWQDP